MGAIYYAIISFIISFIILIIFLRYILQPLKEIENLAKNISKGKFETIKKLPWTLELKNVSISMNDMSNKIKNMLGKLNSNLEKMTEQLSKDDLTNLQLEQTFQTDMKQMFIKKEDGYIFSIKIDNLGEFAKNNPHNVVDKFLKDFANYLKNSHKDINAYRFFGSTFALISKETNIKDIETITTSLKNSLNKLSEEYNIKSVAHIGATPFNAISTTSSILSLANEALETSKQIEACPYSQQQPNRRA
jgi:diguanylate cyclase (GGDEF)-like protein